MSEPLKGKIETYKDTEYPFHYIRIMELRSAVAWLKAKVKKDYYNNFYDVCEGDELYHYLIETIDKAFFDVVEAKK